MIGSPGALRSWAILAAAMLFSACSRAPAVSGACHIIAPAQATKVNIVSYPSPGMPFFGEQVAKCSTPPLLHVRHQMLPFDDLMSQSTISLSSHAPSRYHVIHVSDTQLVEWATRGWLAPLDELVKKYWTQYRLDEIPDRVWEAVRVNGHIYAIPGLQNTESLYYRKDVLAQHGLGIPQTFDELDRTCRLLKARGAAQYPLVMMYSKSSEHFSIKFHDLVHSMGGSWFNADGSPAFNDKTGQAALTRMAGLYRACMDPDTVNFTPEDATARAAESAYWAPGLAAIDRGAISEPRKPYTYLVNALERYGMEALLGHPPVDEGLNRAAS